AGTAEGVERGGAACAQRPGAVEERHVVGGLGIAPVVVGLLHRVARALRPRVRAGAVGRVAVAILKSGEERARSELPPLRQAGVDELAVAVSGGAHLEIERQRV